MSTDTNEVKSKGQVEPWRLLPVPEPIDYLVLLKHDEENLTIILRPVAYRGRYLKVTFDNPLSFRSTQEGLFLNPVDPIPKEWWGITFYKVKNSRFVQEFHDNSSWAFEDWEIIHYAIYASNYCVDILSVEEPTVEWENKIVE